MKLEDLLLLVQAGYSKEDISNMMKSESENELEKKQENEHEKKLENKPEKKPENEPEKKPENDFDYDKLADSIIAKMQANNRSANLDNKNSKDDWLSQLSLKF